MSHHNKYDQPAHNLVFYREETSAFALVLENKQTGDPIDIDATFDEVFMRIFSPGNEDSPVMEPELSINADKITGVITPAENVALFGRTLWYEIWVKFNGVRRLLLPGRNIINNAQSAQGPSATDIHLSIDLEKWEITLQIADSAALALQALADVEAARGDVLEKAEEVSSNRDEVVAINQTISGGLAFSLETETDDFLEIIAYDPATIEDKTDTIVVGEDEYEIDYVELTTNQ